MRKTQLSFGTAALVALCLLVTDSRAQEGFPGGNQSARVTVFAPDVVSIAPGRPSPVELLFRVAPGFHINSHEPKSQLLIPTVVRLSPPTNISVGRVRYPPGKDFSFAFAPGERLNVYSGDFSVTGLVSTIKDTTPGRYRVHGELRYQACDNRACYPPATLPFSFDVRVLGASARSSTRIRRHTTGQSPHIRR